MVATTVTLPGAPTVISSPVVSALAVTLAGSFGWVAVTGGTVPVVDGAGAGFVVVVVVGGAGGAGGAGGRNGVISPPPIDALVAPGAIKTAGELRMQGSSPVVGVPPTFRPSSSVHATNRPSCESETSFAMPAAGRKQSTAPVRLPSTPSTEATAILPIFCVPPSQRSSSSASSLPFAATSVRRSSRPVPVTSRRGSNWESYVDVPAVCA